MTISLSDASKRYNREWIFRSISLEFSTGNAYAITGSNGSGKSTFLQAVGGLIDFTTGKITYEKNNEVIPHEDLYKHVSFTAPYLELIEEMNLHEFFNFHASFKTLIDGHDSKSIAEKIGLTKAADKQIRHYSSGMKQRVNLAQAIFSDTPVLLMDEPCSNLDRQGIELYQSLVGEFGKDRIIIVSSNDPAEYGFCNHEISIMKYKTQVNKTAAS